MKQFMDPCHWFEEIGKYAIENKLNPLLKNKLKIAGSALALTGICVGGFGIPIIYLAAKTGDFSGCAKRIGNYLEEKGYTDEQLSSVLK